jgi:hypothetical protein
MEYIPFSGKSKDFFAAAELLRGATASSLCTLPEGNKIPLSFPGQKTIMSIRIAGKNAIYFVYSGR